MARTADLGGGNLSDGGQPRDELPAVEQHGYAELCAGDGANG